MYGVVWPNDSQDWPLLKAMAFAGLALNAPWTLKRCANFDVLVPLGGFSKPQREVLSDHLFVWVTSSSVSTDDGDECLVVESREGASLLRTLPLLETSTPERSVIFLVAEHSESAERLLSSLLTLGKGDASVETFRVKNETLLSVCVSDAPLYLVLRAMEHEDRVRVFREQHNSLYVEWGYVHPLGTRVADIALEQEVRIFVERGGRWRTLDRPQNPRILYEIVLPQFDASLPQKAEPAPLTKRFAIDLRLAPSRQSEAELFVLDVAALEKLQSAVQSLPAASLQSLTLSRLALQDSLAPLYLLRERHRPGLPSLSTTFAELLGQPGHHRAPGTTSLFIPTNSQLTPRLRHEDLQRFFELDGEHLVILHGSESNANAPTWLRTALPKETPLADITHYMLTDRRHELEEMMEQTLLSLAPFKTTPRKEKPKTPQAIPAKVAAQKKRLYSKPKTLNVPARTEIHAAKISIQRPALEQERDVLEQSVMNAERIEPMVWDSLAALQRELGDLSDSFSSYVIAGFHDDTLNVPLAQTAFDLFDGPQKEWLAMVIDDSPHVPQRRALAALTLQMCADKSDLQDAGTVQQLASRFLVAEDLSLRLRWMVLRALAKFTDDKLLLTRAKEHFLGILNARGPSLLRDIPKFVRMTLVLGGEDQANQEASEDLHALEHFYHALLPLEGSRFFTHFQSIFAVAFARGGNMGIAKSLLKGSRQRRHPASWFLVELYRAKLATPADDWPTTFERMTSLAKPENTRAALWFAKRSDWLRPRELEERAPWIRPPVTALMKESEAKGDFSRNIIKVMKSPVFYGYEVVAFLEHALSHVTATGNESAISKVLKKIVPHLTRLKVSAHRARAAGICVEAAALIGDDAITDTLLDRIVSIARARKPPSPKALLSALRPALVALRRLGDTTRALHFLEQLSEPLAEDFDVSLCATLAEGYIRLEQQQKAEHWMTRAFDVLMSDRLDYLARHEGAKSLLAALAYWPLSDRLHFGSILVAHLEHFKDTFTVGEHFPTFQLLLLEHLLDAVAGAKTFNSERVIRRLESEELAIRRQILKDWNTQCQP